MHHTKLIAGDTVPTPTTQPQKSNSQRTTWFDPFAAILVHQARFGAADTITKIAGSSIRSQRQRRIDWQPFSKLIKQPHIAASDTMPHPTGSSKGFPRLFFVGKLSFARKKQLSEFVAGDTVLQCAAQSVIMDRLCQISLDTSPLVKNQSRTTTSIAQLELTGAQIPTQGFFVISRYRRASVKISKPNL
jgi:hypothetical protein